VTAHGAHFGGSCQLRFRLPHFHNPHSLGGNKGNAMMRVLVCDNVTGSYRC
jgi:hypothetical protein